MKLYEEDIETGKDHKGYAVQESTHEFIAEWQSAHGLSSLTLALKDIVEKVKTLPALKKQLKEAQEHIEFLNGKATLSGMDFKKPLDQSIREQAMEEANRTLKDKELEELRAKVDKLVIKLKKKSKAKKEAEKYIEHLEAEAKKDRIDMNGILKGCIENPQALGMLFNGLKGNPQALQGLPAPESEEAKEAIKFLNWFEELFPEAYQDSIMDILELLSSNPANIIVIKQLLEQNLSQEKTEEHGEHQHSGEGQEG